MRKMMKGVIACLCATTVLFGAAACGKSAYDIAVQNGFTGTEKEWLATLQGVDGKDGANLTAKDLYETAVAEGYEGTYLEFCRDVLKVDLREGNDVDTIARNVTSVVSIYCGFSQTVRTNPWAVQTRYLQGSKHVSKLHKVGNFPQKLTLNFLHYTTCCNKNKVILSKQNGIITRSSS